MKVADVMTRNVITLTPDHSIRHAARIMLEHGVSGLPVMDAGQLVGMLSEGDLLRRVELGLPSADEEGWAAILSAEGLARDFVKSHSWRVADVMSTPVVSVSEDAELSELANLFAARGIKRAAVLRHGSLVGLVSRADLLRIIAEAASEPIASGDDAMLLSVRARLRDLGTTLTAQPTVSVEDGIVRVSGSVQSKAERDAVRVACESTPGLRAFEDHLVMPEVSPHR